MLEVTGFAITRATQALSEERRSELLAERSFGQLFTDHMVTIEWERGRGWHDARLRPREPFSLDPACAVLHYGQEIFEGMKAYRRADGKVGLFRPEQNARRFAKSAARMAMPELPEQLFLEAVEQLVVADWTWIPNGEGTLYLRPFMFANESFLGMRAANRYTFCVIAAPVGDYFDSSGLSLWVSHDLTRAGPGGTGAAKCGGNYAGSLLALNEALANGCDQVVFLDACERRWVEEVGATNIFFVMHDRSIVTPPLGTILDGITRSSVIALARDAGCQVSEERYSFEQWQEDAETGRLVEVFVCGTAATLVRVEQVHWTGGQLKMPAPDERSLSTMLKNQLEGIQRGREADRHQWSRIVQNVDLTANPADTQLGLRP